MLGKRGQSYRDQGSGLVTTVCKTTNIEPFEILVEQYKRVSTKGSEQVNRERKDEGI